MRHVLSWLRLADPSCFPLHRAKSIGDMYFVCVYMSAFPLVTPEVEEVGTHLCLQDGLRLSNVYMMICREIDVMHEMFRRELAANIRRTTVFDGTSDAAVVLRWSFHVMQTRLASRERMLDARLFTEDPIHVVRLVRRALRR